MEFKKIILENCVNDIIDYRGKTPKKLKGEWNEKGTFRAVSAKNIKNMQLVNLESLKKVDNELYKKWMKKEVSKNDILLTSEAPLGESLFWDSDEKIVLSQRVFGLKPNTDIVNPKYLFAYLQTPKFKHELTSRESGTTVTGIRRKELEKTIIEVPSQNIQKFIGDLFYITNKKIKNNQNIIANLEELSQTLFKHWFVDFEFPDENDNPYKSSGGEMIDSELGEIPERWSLGNFENLGKIVGGGTPSKKVSEYYTKQKEIPWITPKDLSKNKNTYIYHGEQDITELGLNKSSAKLINKDSVLFSSRAPIGYIAIAGQEVTTNQGFKSIEVDKNINPYYVFFLLKYKLPIIEQTASGSTFKEISGKGMKSIPIILPIIETINKYGNIVESYFEKIKVLEKENQKLIQLRNTLLPKLMSGEIEIPDDIEVNKDELSI
ncbi:restriction endonuclease subunit S [Staphylococcus sp. IPLA37010]